MMATSMVACSTAETSKGEEILAHPEVTNIKFSWWGNDPRHIYTMSGIEIFEEKYPEIRVENRYGEWNGFEKRNKVWMKSGTEADVMQINYAWISQYSPDGLGYYDIYELSEYIDLSNFSEDDLKLGEVNGHLNAIPIAYNTQMFAVNKDIFDKYGLDVPKDWDDLFEAAEVMSKDGVYPLGMVKKQAFLMLMSYYEQKYGKNFFNEDGSLAASEEEVQSLIEFYCELLDKKVLIPIDQFSQNSFAKGEIAGSMFWISDTGNYCGKAEESGRQVEIVGYPCMAGASRSGRYIKPATLYAISDTTANPKEAALLLNFLLNSTDMADLQGTEKGVPISKAAFEYLEQNDRMSSWQTKATDVMNEERDKMTVIIPAMEDETIIDVFKSSCDDYIYGQVTLEEATRQVYEQIKQ